MQNTVFFKHFKIILFTIIVNCLLSTAAYCDSDNIDNIDDSEDLDALFLFPPAFNKTYLGGKDFSGIPSRISCSIYFTEFTKMFVETHTIIKIKTDNPRHYPVFFSAYSIKKSLYDYPFAIRDQAPLYIKEYDFYAERFKYDMKIKNVVFILNPTTINGLTLGGFYYIFEDNKDTREAFSKDIGFIEIEGGLLVSSKYQGVEMLINHNVFGVPYCDVGIKFW